MPRCSSTRPRTLGRPDRSRSAGARWCSGASSSSVRWDESRSAGARWCSGASSSSVRWDESRSAGARWSLLLRLSCQSSRHLVSYSCTWAGNPVRRSPATNDGTTSRLAACSVSHRLGERSAARRRSPLGYSRIVCSAAAITASSARWSSPDRSPLAGRSPPTTRRSRSGSRASSLRRAGKVPSAMPHTTARSNSTPRARSTGPTRTPAPRRPCRLEAVSNSSCRARRKAANEGFSSVPSRSPSRVMALSTRSASPRSSSGHLRRTRPPKYF